MQTLQKLHLSNRLYIEQVTCHLLMLLLSARAYSETAKRNSVCFQISFDRSLPLIETSQLICVANWLTAFFVIRELRGLRLISGLEVLRWAHGFCKLWSNCLWICGEYVLLFLFYFMCFRRGFSRRGVGWGLCILRCVISKYIIVLFFFVVLELALSRSNLLKVDIS